ncbi:RagB/SusD family nutrient uptake outer membrane protein [Zhouia spongiae]|uniref:RagB/SusD family nutrient uptake outer membrane protein n=1 Tax=Zhouia spongiae TaxID=2202721 RepID=A0ABY3YM28_9FLAO|nr:RagB/SusD family nutrient uptake outer membrane protein [Zhouia spongiae]UNY98753.1 RagB/SusD family nutrient uptake outer membrane protein [Zhouia spongiae]
MKKIYSKILLAGLLTGGLVSCDKELDLAPTDVLIEKTVFSDVATAESALADVYFKLALASVGPTHIIADASLGHVGLKEGNSYSNYYSGDLIATDFNVEGIWTKYYEAINVANVFIDKVPEFATYNEDIQKQHMAEARFNRAYAYHMLLSYYGHGALTGNMEGLGLPLQLEPYNGYNEEDQLARSSNDEVYGQIISDLELAIQDLPEIYSDKLTTRVRATKNTARALLSRVYLYMRDYQKSLDMSNRVLASSEYKLDADLLNLFPLNTAGTSSEFSDEVIFGFPFSGNGGNHQFGLHGIYYYNKYQWADAGFISSMDENDKRRTELIYEGNPAITDPVTRLEETTFKFNNPDGRDDIIVIRLAEIMLNKAEALVQINGVNAASVSLLNEIKTRSGLPEVNESDFASKEALLNEIYHERYLETVFEGRARFDFIRTGRPLKDPNLTEDQKTFPIPLREIDLSGGILEQNPGY